MLPYIAYMDPMGYNPFTNELPWAKVRCRKIYPSSLDHFPIGKPWLFHISMFTR